MNDTALYMMTQEGIATLTLNRPEARNALNTALAEALLEGARRAAAEAARLLLLRANGPVFCAGADLKERKGMSDDAVRARRLKAFAAYDAIERLPMPVIAVVEGPAVGSGCEIAAACDFVIATPAASFRTPEALWGTVGATQRLPRVLGKRLAKDMMFTGRTLSAAEAREAGLVARVVAPEALEQVLAEIAATIAKAPASALALAKRCIDDGLERDPRGALATELMAIEESLAAAEWRRTMAGFGGGAE
jgi:enoyl-CoA hydratase